MDSILYFFQYSYADLFIIGVAIYAAFIYPSLGPELKRLAHVLFLSGISETLILLFIFNGYPSIPGQHLYVLINAILVSRFYALLFRGFVSSNIVYGFTALFCLLSILNTLFLQSIHTFASNALTLSGLIFTTFSLFTYIVLYNKIVQQRILAEIKSLTWANSGFFIFYFLGLLIFHFARYWNEHQSVLTFLFSTAFKWVNFLSYTCLAIALWIRPQKSS